MIAAQCPACHTIFSVADEFAGRAVECHSCGTPTLVPHVIRGDAILTAQGHQRLPQTSGVGRQKLSVEATTARAVNKVVRMLCAWLLIIFSLALMLWIVYEYFIPPYLLH
jgi:predicted Zn finger-like uncharacterized protein